MGEVVGVSTWADVAVRWEGKRTDVVRAFVVHGAVEEAAVQCDVPVGVVRHWCEEAWWRDAVAFHRSDVEGVMRARLSAIARKALNEIEDRLDNGDVKLDKYGEKHRVPVGAKDAAVIAGIALQARAAMERAGVDPAETVASLVETLRKVGRRVGVEVPQATQRPVIEHAAPAADAG